MRSIKEMRGRKMFLIGDQRKQLDSKVADRLTERQAIIHHKAFRPEAGMKEEVR